MKNYWLDKKVWLNNEMLTKGVVEYKAACNRWEAGKSNAMCIMQPAHDNLYGMFKTLTKRILEFAGESFIKQSFEDEDSVVDDCISVCFEKLRRYDPTKGKAFNFFTTIVLGHMRQLYMCEKRTAKMKEVEMKNFWLDKKPVSRKLTLAKVTSNTDLFKMGRIMTDKQEMLWPLASGKSGEIHIPPVGADVLVVDDKYYMGNTFVEETLPEDNDEVSMQGWVEFPTS